MNFTFGIVTSGTQDIRLAKIVQSIYAQNIPKFEILIIGNSKIYDKHVRVIPFNESIKKAWITRKKNMITENASFENIVYMHDYIRLDNNWYKGFLEFGNDFHICMTKMLTPNDKRYRDWTIDAMAKISHIVEGRNYERLLPYEDLGLSKIMYISGAYWIAKKSIMEQFPLDENLVWGEAEDIEWSYRVRNFTNFSINPNSCVKLLVEKNPSFVEIKKDLLERFKNLSSEELQIIENHAKEYYQKTHGRPL